MNYFKIYLTITTFLFLLIGKNPSFSQEELKSKDELIQLDQSQRRYTKKILFYKEIINKAGIPLYYFEYFVNTLRKSLEIERFDYREVNVKSIDEFIKVVNESSYEIAQNIAEYDVRWKEINVTLEDLERAKNSGYFYEGTLNSCEILRFVDKNQNVHYLTYMEAYITFYKIDYSYDKGYSVKKIKTIKARKSPFSLTEIFTTLIKTPTRKLIDTEFEAFKSATDTICLILQTKMREISDFQLVIPVQKATLNGVEFSIGKKEGLKKDTGFYLYEYDENGKRKRVGYVKTRKVGKVEKDGVQQNSYAENITVYKGFSFQGGEEMEENPKLGLSINFYTGITPQIKLSKEITAEKFFMEKGLPITFFPGIEFNLGPYINLSEFYLTTDFDFTTVVDNGITNLNYHGLFGLRKRFYLRRLILLCGISGGFGQIIKGSDCEECGYKMLGFDSYLGGEIFIVPTFSIGGRFGYRYFTGNNEYNYNAIEKGLLLSFGFSVNL